MQIFKFKDLSKPALEEHFLEIVLDGTIWCAKPESLNDDAEFRFELDYIPSEKTERLLAKNLQKYGNSNLIPADIAANLVIEKGRLPIIARPIFDALIEQCRRTLGVTSYSATKDDPNLWKEYGGNGNGAFITFDIPDIEIKNSLHYVEYVPDKRFHIDTVLEAALFPDKRFKAYQSILLTKTKKWDAEKEIRFIGNRQDVKLVFDGRITNVTFGPSLTPHTLNRLLNSISSHCISKNIKIVVLQGGTKLPH